MQEQGSARTGKCKKREVQEQGSARTEKCKNGEVQERLQTVVGQSYEGAHLFHKRPDDYADTRCRREII